MNSRAAWACGLEPLRARALARLLSATKPALGGLGRGGGKRRCRFCRSSVFRGRFAVWSCRCCRRYAFRGEFTVRCCRYCRDCGFGGSQVKNGGRHDDRLLSITSAIGDESECSRKAGERQADKGGRTGHRKKRRMGRRGCSRLADAMVTFWSSTRPAVETTPQGSRHNVGLRRHPHIFWRITTR